MKRQTQSLILYSSAFEERGEKSNAMMMARKTQGPTGLLERSHLLSREMHMKIKHERSQKLHKERDMEGPEGKILEGEEVEVSKTGRPQERRFGEEEHAWHQDRKNRQRTNRKSGFYAVYTSICDVSIFIRERMNLLAADR